MAVINAALIASLTHINIAVSRALLNKRDGKLRTESLGNEIVYHCDAQHSIQHSLSNYGL
jgi:tRNA threonylcarbamoyladenosine modification (KEOPS) complex Cgi121 subunit